MHTIASAAEARQRVDQGVDVMKGQIEAMALYAGQSAGLVHDMPSAADLVRRLAGQSRDVLADAFARL